MPKRRMRFLSESLAGPQNIAPMPRVCAQLAELTAQQATDAAQLARLIQSDAALAGELMRVANSPALRPRSPIVSLQQAVSWLGVAEVRNIAMAVMLRGEVFTAPGHEPESEELWREAWLAGLWAKEIARERRKHVESAFLAALMHRTGAALALKILSGFESQQRTVMDAKTFSDLVVEFEPRFGRLLMSSWRLPDDVQDAASDWRDYRKSSHSDLGGHGACGASLRYAHAASAASRRASGARRCGVRAARRFSGRSAPHARQARSRPQSRGPVDAIHGFRSHLSRVGSRRPEGCDSSGESRLSRLYRRARDAGRRLLPAVRHHPQQGAARTGAQVPAHAGQRDLAGGRAARRCAAVGAVARRRCGDRSAGQISARAAQAQRRRVDPRQGRLFGCPSHRGSTSRRFAPRAARRPRWCSPPGRGRGTWPPSRWITSTSSTAIPS